MKLTALATTAFLFATTSLVQAAPIDGVIATLAEQGFTVTEVETKNGLIYVEAIRDGLERELIYVAATGALLKDEFDGKLLFGSNDYDDDEDEVEADDVDDELDDADDLDDSDDEDQDEAEDESDEDSDEGDDGSDEGEDDSDGEEETDDSEEDDSDDDDSEDDDESEEEEEEVEIEIDGI
jgi:hypothetical protein